MVKVIAWQLDAIPEVIGDHNGRCNEPAQYASANAPPYDQAVKRTR